MRSMWKGMISFGMVNIPVALINATKKKNVSFNQLRASDYSRIKYKKIAGDGTEIQPHEIVRGYEIGPNRYVVITDDELAATEPASSRIIEITDFVKLNQINPLMYESSYYLVPEAGANKAYALLLAALREADTVGIARLVLRNKEYLAAIRAENSALSLSTMLFDDEVVKPEELASYLPKNTLLTEKELAMARHLVEALSTDFEPSKYKNQHYEQVMQLIDKKAAESAINITPVVKGGRQVIDIMEAIEATLASIKSEKPAANKRTKKTG